MAKKRIYEVAKELDIENKIVVKKAQDLGFDVKSHMSSLDDKQVSKLVDSLKSTNTTPSTEKDSKNSSRKEKAKIKVSVGAIRRRDNKNEHDNRHGNNKHRNNNFKKPANIQMSLENMTFWAIFQQQENSKLLVFPLLCLLNVKLKCFTLC